MLISVPLKDLESAPKEVHHWFRTLLETDLSKPTEKKKPVTINDVLERAAAFIDSQGEDSLQEILTDLDVKRVRECPEEKLPELLARLAVV